MSPPTPPSTGETLVLTNPNGTLWCKPIKWVENQLCTPAIRPLPLGQSEYLDADTYVLKPRTLDFIVRLSDSDKKIFEAIYTYASIIGSNQYTDIYLYYNDSAYIWHYTAWISDKNYKWEYSMESGRKVRWWYVTITCNVKDFSGTSSTEPSYSLSTVTIDNHTLDFILDFERTDKHPPMLPNWINQTEAVDSYLWNECVLDVAYTYRATNDEKYLMDITLRNHSKVVYEDYIHNLFSKAGAGNGAWISSIEAQWDDTNWEKPWKITVAIQANNSEIESKSGTIDVSTSNAGQILIDGEDIGTLPTSVVLDYGIHDVFFIPTSGIGIINDSDATIFVYGDGTLTVGSPEWYSWAKTGNIDIIESFWKGSISVSLCPSGEQVVNGGFETGDLTGWTVSGNISIGTYEPHSGVYKAWAVDLGFVSVEQDVINPVPQECISTFSFWYYGDYDPCGELGSKVVATIIYTDETFTIVQHETTSEENNIWVEIDLKSSVEVGKIVKRISIAWTDNETGAHGSVDDISLVGTG